MLHKNLSTMKKRNGLAVLAILVFALIAGCGKSNSRQILDYEYRVGAKGLEMKFTDGAPPNELYENGDFIISYDVSNEGANDIDNGVFSLSIEDDYMRVRDWNGYLIKASNANQKSTSFAILGKSRLLPDGEKSVVTVRASTRALDEQTETHTSMILLTACYPYKTYLAQEVCIDRDVYKTRSERKVCQVQTIALTNQGAPVAIIKIEPLMLDSEDHRIVTPQFNIYVRNIGNGEVFNSGKIQEACSSSPLAREDINLVTVRARLSDKQLQCTPSTFRLSNKEGLVRCNLESGYDRTGGTFISPLVVELEYGYSFTITRSVIIKRQNILSK